MTHSPHNVTSKFITYHIYIARINPVTLRWTDTSAAP